MFVMTRKIKALNFHLKEWNKEVFRDKNVKVEQAPNSLEAVHVDVSVNGMIVDKFQVKTKAQAISDVVQLRYELQDF